MRPAPSGGLVHLFRVAVATALLLCSIAADAQRSPQRARIGFLALSGPNPNMDVSRGLRELGWTEGKNLSIEYRWAAGREDRLPGLAAELVRLNVDVIVTSSTPAALAAKQATRKIPVVFTFVADPLGSGIVESLARPGGNITGLTTIAPELVAKRLELLKQVAPASRVAVLWDPAGLTERTRQHMREETEAAARLLGVNVQFSEVRTPNDFERAFAAMREARVGAVLVSPTPMLFEARNEIVAQANRSRLPAVYAWREAVDAGGLVSYATNFPEMYRRAAIYVDKILRGASPAALPVEQPTRFELVINLKTARTLGLSIPDAILQRADEVIR